MEHVNVPFNDLNAVSVMLLNALDAHEVDPPTALGGTAMTLGRLAADHVLDPIEDTQFVHAITDWITAYFSTGMAN